LARGAIKALLALGAEFAFVVGASAIAGGGAPGMIDHEPAR
jgi:hypothetical protein